MSKSIALLPRRNGLSRAQFRDYYESHHAPLAIRYFPFSRYVRNHLTADEAAGFDTISEFWSEDIAAVAALMQTPIGSIMRADEERFMDRAQIRSAAAEEHLLWGPACTAEAAGSLKHAWLLLKDPGMDEAAFVASVTGWTGEFARGHGGACERVALDLVRPWGPKLPFDAILWLWMSEAAAAAPPPGATLWRCVTLRPEETAPAVMAQALLAQGAHP
jgi:uncharacterized protein (TIGR02118 family)